MRHLFQLGVIVFLLCSSIIGCKSFDPSLLRPREVIPQRLPPLEVQIDQGSMESAFSLGSTTGNAVGYSAPVFGGYVTAASLSGKSFKDRRIQDSIVVFDREINDNICELSGAKKGYAVCRIASSTTSDNWAWLILSAWGPYILGSPVHSSSIELDIEVEILDLQRNKVARYSAIGKDTEYSALYWGYSDYKADRDDTTLSRVLNAQALLNAMVDIKKQIQRDAVQIIEKLSK